MITCTKCKTERPDTDFYKRASKNNGRVSQCRFCSIAQTKEWRQKDKPQKLAMQRASNFKLLYGISEEDRKQMLQRQQFSCAICSTTISDTYEEGRKSSAKVDHCHATGRVRGLLCNACNTGIGLFKEDTHRLRHAISYLDQHKGVHT